jgi:arginase family enzyme
VTDVVALVGRTSDRANGRAAVARRWPDAWLLWLDAHGDFNTPDTTPGGLDATQLRDQLADVAAQARIVGAEITCPSTPELSGALAQAAAPLLESPAR